MKGYIIDCAYIIKVSELMKPLPRPVKKLIDNDGTLLPLITVTTELWE